MALKYSVVSDTIRRLGFSILETPREVCEAIKAAGYDGVDLPGSIPDGITAADMKQITQSLGLEIPEVQGAWAYFHARESRDLAGADPEARRRGVEYSKKMIDWAAQLGARYFEICAAQPPVPEIPFPRTPIQTLRRNFIEAAREICEYAAVRGVTVLLEPLNRYEAYPGVLTTVYEAVSLIDALGLPNVGIQPDIYHMNIAEASIPGALRAAGHRIKVLHMNETNHYRLGAGHADYTMIIATLKQMGFDGHISIYMPLIAQEVSQVGYNLPGGAEQTGSVTLPDLKSVLEMQLRFAKEVEKAVDAQTAIYPVGAPYIVDAAAPTGTGGVH